MKLIKLAESGVNVSAEKTTEIALDARAVRLLIGPQGTTTRELQPAHGAKIDAPRTSRMNSNVIRSTRVFTKVFCGKERLELFRSSQADFRPQLYPH